MRLFTGIELPAEVKQDLSGLLSRLRPTARLKWSPVQNLHITTKFIGEWPEPRLEALAGILAQTPLRGPVSITVGGLGWFPNPRAPRVFWAGIQADAALGRLAKDTNTLLERLRIPAETKPLSPHLTLARIKEPVPLEQLRQAIEALPSLEFGSFAADRFYLYLSERGPAGSVYTKLKEFLLTHP